MQVKIHLSGPSGFLFGGFFMFWDIKNCEIMKFCFIKRIANKVNKPTFQSYCNIIRAVAISLRIVQTDTLFFYVPSVLVSCEVQ